MRQGRVYSRDFGFNNLRHGVASANIRQLVKRANYLVGIYLLTETRYFRFLVIISSTNIMKLLQLLLILTLYF